MPTETITKVRAEALALSESERAELAYTLLQSLDAPPGAEVAQAWETEIRRRLAEVENGTAVLMDMDEFRRKAEAWIADTAKTANP